LQLKDYSINYKTVLSKFCITIALHKNNIEVEGCMRGTVYKNILF
jgi:hypothetical protein